MIAPGTRESPLWSPPQRPSLPQSSQQRLPQEAPVSPPRRLPNLRSLAAHRLSTRPLTTVVQVTKFGAVHHDPTETTFTVSPSATPTTPNSNNGGGNNGDGAKGPDKKSASARAIVNIGVAVGITLATTLFLCGVSMA
ncbi:hypothetical protein MCOR25_008992 [Pyricularia grisea]|nr:hypothetical protein MCOR25_008992 [Pyricularia grisea]